jgi:4'-phosphopantetheinyl transferase
MNEVNFPAPTVRVLDYRYDPDALGSQVLPHDEIHVWKQKLNSEFAGVELFGRTLSADELQRAGRFRFDAGRNEYIVARGTLRVLLGSYLNIPPGQLLFTYSEYGRPSLVNDSPVRDVDFNISHSSGVALLAFARGRKIGIDVEYVRRDFGTSEIAEHFFSTAERAVLRDLPQEQRHEAFFRCWTRKEAYIKALGEGLSHPLDQFDVSLAPAVPAALLATRPDAQEVRHWKLWDIEVPGDYAAALAAETDSRHA